MAERPRGQSRFYESLGSESNIPYDFSSSHDNEKDLKSLQHSKHLPKWTWKLLVQVLGIKLTGRKRVPCLSIVIQGVFLILACTFTITGMVHTVYDIKSEYSRTTLLIGCVNIFIGFGWLSLGIYSQKLAGRLFTNRNFAESVRIHSRTYFKISAAGLLMVLSVAAVTLNCYNDYSVFGPDHCVRIFLHPAVCHVMYGSHVAFSIMSLVWNVLVGCVLLSVCRTHTIGISLTLAFLYCEWFNFRGVPIFVVFVKGLIRKIQYPLSSDFLFELLRKILWPQISNPTNVWFLFNPWKLVPTNIKPSRLSEMVYLGYLDI